MTQNPDDHEEIREESRQVPIVEDDFAKLLQKFKIKAELAANIAENISHTGGPTVFENPELLTKRVRAWSGEIAPAKRKLIIEQWFAEKGIEVSPELIQKAGLTTEQAGKADSEAEDEDNIRYVYDIDKRLVRMASKNERGGTLEQAKELKKMADESDSEGKESPFIPDANGALQLNPKARITGLEMLAFDSIKKSQERGETVDPIEALAQAAEKMKTFREMFGGSSGNQPDWMTDPAKFVALVRDIGGGDGGAGKPAWMSDPMEFIKIIREISGEGKGDDKVAAQITELQSTISTMRDETHKAELARLGEQMTTQAAAHAKQMAEIATKIEEAGKTVTGRTELDILFEVAKEGISVIKTEASGMRSIIKEVVSSPNLPPSKSEEERETRKGDFRKALESDRRIDELAERLFFPPS